MELLLVALLFSLVLPLMALQNSLRSATAKKSCGRMYAAKFDPSNFIKVSVKKPLGLVLQEVAENKKEGVTIAEIDPSGSAKASGKLAKGLFLLEINGQDMKYNDFDTIMDNLIAAPADKPIELVFIEPNKVFKGPAKLKVKLPEGQIKEISTVKGLNMRRVLMDAGIKIYADKASFTNCGGAGTCGTCAVVVLDNKDWEPRPDFEAKRLKKYPAASRLSCNAVIEGDCTIVTIPPRID